MELMKEGQKVCISFEAKLETGETVLKTEEEKPLEITIGEGAIPESIEKALLEMKVGETKSIKLEPTEAFGPVINDLIIDMPRKGFNEVESINVGSKVSMASPEGKKFFGTVVEIGDETVKVDFNHPLAGKNLLFTITIVSAN